jgi:hypothetical protein
VRPRERAALTVDEVRATLKELAALGLISEASGISWDDDADRPRDIVLHLSPADVQWALGFDDSPDPGAAA